MDSKGMEGWCQANKPNDKTSKPFEPVMYEGRTARIYISKVELYIICILMVYNLCTFIRSVVFYSGVAVSVRFLLHNGKLN